MMAASDNTGNGRANNPKAPKAGGAASVVQPEFDSMLGQHVARAVMRQDPGARRAQSAKGERVGGKGSNLYRCIVTDEVLPREQMFRFVVAPDNKIVPDLEEKLSGRGYWVKADFTVLGQAMSDGAFIRAAGKLVEVPPALRDQVVEQSRQAALNLLGLARRAWAIELGYEHVRAALLARKIGLVFIASNAPLDFHRKLQSVTENVPVLTIFTTAQLSLAFGQERLAYAAIQKGQWSVRLLAHCKRLEQIIPQTNSL